jgi:hypothetical protein
MTRDEALIKLLSIEPEMRSQIVLATGWGVDETLRRLDTLVAQGRVTYCTRNTRGIHGERLYYPADSESRAAGRNAGALPGPSGASRSRVRNVGGGQLREGGALELGRAWAANPQGSGSEEGEQC